MIIDGKRISENLLNLLKKERKKIKKPINLTVFLIGESPDQMSFVKIKSRIAKELHINFKFIHLKKTPNFINFINQIKQEASSPSVTGIIIQQPLPAQLSTDSIYDYLPMEKEIEGHKKKSLFTPPLGLAVLTIVKYIFGAKKTGKELFVNIKKDQNLFRKIFKSKRVVVVGRGITGGKPIGQTLSEVKINYLNVNSTTINPENYYKNADLIITAVGRKVLDQSIIKPGVVLINVGLRRENGHLKGDYEEKEIKDIASFYTPTPGGSGPIDVIYLYRNLIDAAKLQK